MSEERKAEQTNKNLKKQKGWGIARVVEAFLACRSP
jgi:hypothetical protein